MNDATSKLVPSEVRFTQKDKSLHAFIFNWNQDKVMIHSLARKNGIIGSLGMLGLDGEVSWKQTDAGLEIELPLLPGSGDIPVRGFKISLE